MGGGGRQPACPNDFIFTEATSGQRKVHLMRRFLRLFPDSTFPLQIDLAEATGLVLPLHLARQVGVAERLEDAPDTAGVAWPLPPPTGLDRIMFDMEDGGWGP